jgi:hypothetical protein
MPTKSQMPRLNRDCHPRKYSMLRRMTRPFIVAIWLMMVAMASAQTQRQEQTFSIQGYAGETNVVRFQGRMFVELEDLARITNGSVSFEKGRMVLTLPHGDAPQSTADDAGRSGFSRPFTSAAIEAMASIREWGGMLQVIVQNGYPLGRAMSGNTVLAYQGRAADSVSIAAAAASTDSDHQGVELLRNEFNNLRAWSESFVDARNAMRAVNLTTSEHPLQDNDEQAQKITHCGQFLAQMFAGGTFQDDPACH